MEAIFRFVLITSLYASVTGTIILLIKKVLKNKINARWHYIIWFVLIIKLIIPFGPESRFSLFNTEPLKITQTKVSNMIYPGEQQFSHSPVITDESVKSKTFKTDTSTVETTENKVRSYVHYIWFLGVITTFLWLISMYYSLHRKLKLGNHYNDERVAIIFNNCKKKLHIDRDIKINIQDIVKTPALFGYLKPRILLSKEILRLNDKEIEYVLIHELSHYKRKDVLANYILLLFQIIHWFNPIMWYCFKRVRQDMEVATDERVLSILDGSEHREYGKALLAVLEGFKTPIIAPKLIGMVDDKKNMERRIKMIKNAKFFNKKAKVCIAIGIICTVLLGVVLLTSGRGNDQEDLIEEGTEVLQYQDKEGGPILLNHQDGVKDEGAKEVIKSEVNEEVEDTLQSETSEEVEDTYLYQTGRYVGQIDSNSIEVKVSGTPDGLSEKVFRLKEEYKEEFETLKLEEEEEIKLYYRIDENNQYIVYKIERIDTNNSSDAVTIEDDFRFIFNGNEAIGLLEWDDKINLNELLGEPLSQKIETIGAGGDTFEGSKMKYMIYNGIEIKLMSPKDNAKTFYILNMTATSNEYKTSRGIKVGDTLEQILLTYNGVQKGDTVAKGSIQYKFVDEEFRYIEFLIKNDIVVEIKIGMELR